MRYWWRDISGDRRITAMLLKMLLAVMVAAVVRAMMVREWWLARGSECLVSEWYADVTIWGEVIQCWYGSAGSGNVK